MSGRGPDRDPDPIEIEIDAAHAGDRLDRALSSKLPGCSRATIQRWIHEGRVTLDGRPIEGKARARAGQRVRVQPSRPPPSDAIPEDIPLSILYEDEHLAVIDKAAGLVVHPAAGHSSGTLVNALVHRYGASWSTDGTADDSEEAPARAPRPGIVHRLDRGTSGVMVIARTGAARDHLTKLFATHAIEREYLAIALGAHPVRATYDTMHARHPSDRKRFTTRVARGGRRAITHVERIEALYGASLVRCRLETGRTHQIRVHLSEHGHPLLGDPVYGAAPSKDPRLREAAEELGRQALHAAVLGFPHPQTGTAMRFETTPPPDLLRAIERLRGTK